MNRGFEDDVFTEDELSTLKEVVSTFGKTNTNAIIGISHTEEAWEKNVKDGKKVTIQLQS